MNSVGTCKFFNGFMHPIYAADHGQERCDAGVVYAEHFPPGRAPCIAYAVEHVSADGKSRSSYGLVQQLRRKEWRVHPEGTLPCGRRCEPTDEENDAAVHATEEHIRRHFSVMQLVSKWRVRPKPKQTREETLVCPVCKGALRVWQAAYNGHCGGQCETPGCAIFQE